MIAGGTRYILYKSRSTEFTLWHLSDFHLLNLACAEDQLRQDLKRIKDDPYALWTGGGDFCEFINYTDKRFDPSNLPDWVPSRALGYLGEFAYEYLKKLLLPIRDKCLGLCEGNHEEVFGRMMAQQNMFKRFCEDLRVPYFGYCALFDMVFVRRSRTSWEGLCEMETTAKALRARNGTRAYHVYIHHGAGGARTPGGQLNRLVKFMDDFAADITLTGHLHGKIAHKMPRIGGNRKCSVIVADGRCGVMSGGYLKTYAQDVVTYGERRGYSPVDLGPAKIRISPDKGELIAEI